MGKKTPIWTHEEITRETACLIQFLVLRTVSLPEEDARLFRAWAYGVHCAWEALTLDGGDERRVRDYMEQLSVLRKSMREVLGADRPKTIQNAGRN